MRMFGKGVWGSKPQPPEALFALACLLVATPATAAVRTLFVGIDSYAHSAGKPGNTDPGFKDLSGAVNDVVLMRQVLGGPRWGLALGDFRRGDPCPGGAALAAASVTLVDRCATRAAILAALTAQITGAAPGDILLFYFSGHGSQALDRERRQVGGKNGTLIAHDGRGSDRGVRDILDTDIDRLLGAANDRGVSTVTIADSCHSGTITRDIDAGAARFAGPQPGIAAPATDIVPPPPRAHDARPYRILLAAAADGEIAREKPIAGEAHGVFTASLAAALAAPASRSYADLAAAVRTGVAALGASQTPAAEGPLATAILGAEPASARIFAAEMRNGALVIGGGRLSGVTPGSRFAVFAGRGAPPPGAVPLATGRVAAVRAGDADLQVPAGLVASAAMVAVETEHAYAGVALRLKIIGANPAQRAALDKALAGLDAVAIVATGATHRLDIGADTAQLSSIDGAPLGSGFPAGGDRFAIDARDRLRQLAHFSAVMALANDQGARWGALDFTQRCADPRQYPALAPGADGLATAYAGDRLLLAFTNRSPTAKFAYLLALGGRSLEIALLRADQQALPPGTTLDHRITARAPEISHILLLLTDAAVQAAALEQPGSRDAGLAPPANALERLLLAARAGRSSRDIAGTGDWGAMTATIAIQPSIARKGPPPCPPPP